MQPLTTDLINRACRIFVDMAYPKGEASIPVTKRPILELPPGLAMLEQVSGNPAISNCCQVVHAKGGGLRALLIRLGCAHYPNLKLKVHLIEGAAEHERPRQGEWLFSVDTHDAFSKTNFLPPPDHPEAAAWRQLQAANVALKEKIEAAWADAGLLTFNGLLRRDLPEARPFNS